jgi:(S)-sulfolactate dehydrogenase
MRVVVAEFMSREGLEWLSRHTSVLYDPHLGAEPGRLRAHLPAAEALIVRNRVHVGPDLLEAAPRLRVVGRLGAGLDNLDLPALRAAGVEVVYAPGLNAGATAEFTIALALALARRLRAEWLGGLGPDWSDRAAHTGIELGGRTFGIVGLGRVGQAVARRARALGMDLLAVQPGRDPDDPLVRELGVELVELPELMRRAHVVSLHCPLTPQTRGLIGRRELALVQPGTLLINTARGGLVDERALALALREGWLGGAALDVRETEPPPVPDPLDGVPGLIRTPHVAGLTQEAQRLTSLHVAREVLRVLQGQGAASAGRPEPLPGRPAAPDPVGASV